MQTCLQSDEFLFRNDGTALSPGWTRLAPPEAARRPVTCCFERPEQLHIFLICMPEQK